MAARQLTCILPLVLLLFSCCIGRSACREPQQQRRRREDEKELPPPLLLFRGSLRNDLGEAVEDARVQFWQADSNGNYFHPGDGLDGHELMADTFSYFGMAATDVDGRFEFKTYRPGIYKSRPVTHIHFKVILDDAELLTSQFYFFGETAAESYDDMLKLELEPAVNETDGTSFLRTDKTVVVDTNGGGNETLTPAQREGPFYPLVDYEDFEKVGNDMTAGLPEEFYKDPDRIESASGSMGTKISIPCVLIALNCYFAVRYATENL